ncbi:MAG: hypothetical protein WBQ94_06395, partial [Terracidiphilus sp.]
LKSEHRLERNRLEGVEGNAINALLSAAAMNFHKLLGAFWCIFLFRLSNAWTGLLIPQRPKARNPQFQFA